MCKFCEDNFKIETTICESELILYLEEENRTILNIRIPFQGGGGITKPIAIKNCPFCGENLKV